MNKFQPIFEKQKDYFNTDATKSYEWRIEQLDRMAKMLNENKEAFQEAVSKDFKTALEEKVFEVAAPLATIEFTKIQLREWMKPISAVVPKALAASGHTAQVIREPYGVTLIIAPFNGPLFVLPETSQIHLIKLAKQTFLTKGTELSLTTLQGLPIQRAHLRRGRRIGQEVFLLRLVERFQRLHHGIVPQVVG